MTLVKDTRVAIGGLMRCCTGTLWDWIAAHEHEGAVPGTVVACRYEKERPTTMVLWPDFVWRWNRIE